MSLPRHPERPVTARYTYVTRSRCTAYVERFRGDRAIVHREENHPRICPLCLSLLFVYYAFLCHRASFPMATENHSSKRRVQETERERHSKPATILLRSQNAKSNYPPVFNWFRTIMFDCPFPIVIGCISSILPSMKDSCLQTIHR